MEIAKTIDHTNLKPNATEQDIIKLCAEAKQYGFRSVCINPRWTKLAKKELKGSNIKIVVVIDWPNGASLNKARIEEAKAAKKEGADEIDPVLDIGNFKMGNYDLVLKELKELAKILPTKLIIETGYLTDEEIKIAAALVKEAGCYCVKTSTGLDPKVDIDKKIEQIKIIREVVGSDYPIKFAGGVKTMEDAKRAIEAGANIIGTSSALKIIGVSQKEGDY
jgi:deoxyribose-phosphate aldolase